MNPYGDIFFFADFLTERRKKFSGERKFNNNKNKCYSLKFSAFIDAIL